MMDQKSHSVFQKGHLILYHGSRGGLDGEIAPISRERCDFGKGFYLGDNSMQVKSLVAQDADPIFYTIELDLSKIPKDRILVLSGIEWVYAVLACRKRVPEIQELKKVQDIRTRIEHADLVVGPLADDRMNEAVRAFSSNALSMEGLLHCLDYIDYGNQYVLRTQHACSCASVLDYHEIYGQEADLAIDYGKTKRQQSRNVVRDMQMKYNANGLFLSQLLANEQKCYSNDCSNEQMKEEAEDGYER
jgi:hypothetical protein